MLPFIIAGLVSGAVYGLAGVGLVLTYKTSGVFNFAHGALATIAAYAFYFLHVQHKVPWPVAVAIILAVVGPVVGGMFAALAKALANASLAVKVAATVGVLLVVQYAFTIIYGTTQVRTVPPYLPTNSMTLFGTQITAEKIIVFAVALILTALLYLFFRWSRMGMAMRAVVDDAPLLDLAGTNPSRARRWSWIIGVEFATISGLLLASFVPLTGTTLTFLVIQAFGAAALGSFTSLPVTFIGGIGIGVVGALATKYFTGSVFEQVPASLPFIVLFLVLLLFPKRWLQVRSAARPASRPTWVAPAPFQLLCGVVVVVLLAFVPSWVGFHLNDWTLALTSVMVFLSLGLLVRTSGQVSLCQVTFTAIGAAAFSHFAVDMGIPWVVALLLAGLVAVPIGALLAIPAIRLGGLYLALATLGFGIAVSQMFYTSGSMFGALGFGLKMPRPSWLGLDSDEGFYYLCLVLAVLTALFVIALSHSRLGRLLRGMADSPLALTTNGATVNVTRVLVFCISAFIAAIAGSLAGMVQFTVTGDNYQPLTSLAYIALIIIVPGGVPWYAMLAAFGLSVLPSYIPSPDAGNYLQIFFGIGAIAYALRSASATDAVPAWLRELLDGIFHRPPFTWRPRTATMQVAADSDAPRVQPANLAVDGLCVQFGGLVAVNDVTIEAESGRITGLIGPNGAGKTTTFNSCSGLNQPTRGHVLFDSKDVTRRGAAARARRGLGRTFQQMELFDSLSVWENVAVGAEAARAGANPVRHVLPRMTDRRRVDDATVRALELCGLAEVADASVGGLSTGQRRLVELARCLAGDYRVLLLDEPSSGLDRAETLRFGEILTDVVRQRGVGILLVEHDMALVNDVCDYIYVLDFGRLIYSGTPSQVMSSEIVQAAYLGGEVVIDDRAQEGAELQEETPR
ncbi:ATP-binding cassette domain-containing protein [Nocardia sp. CA2R105]|uniref:branched-chain amino acid ABC transporter permease/ATP-binding protein n=1 Tax=Nocardia coffeae TaxID=2873381 RepID=UPI001CA66305|nr:branched-chain amino acid ABC transporter permease/ATP-binding protein [Nocardia coffeae]MBY8862948.1 ATP-binding cassette domain-containing protein [Nocardia coffeae]